jgi:hypothetical protein
MGNIDWIPIADLPDALKDGRYLLVSWKNGGGAAVVWWNEKRGYRSFTTGASDRCGTPDQYAPDWFSHFAEINPPA